MLYFILLWTIQQSEAQSAKRRAQGVEGEAEGIEQRTAGYSRIPLYASLIFIAHPVQTQAVTYIVNRSAVLATFFTCSP